MKYFVNWLFKTLQLYLGYRTIIFSVLSTWKKNVNILIFEALVLRPPLNFLYVEKVSKKVRHTYFYKNDSDSANFLKFYGVQLLF